MIFGFCSTPAIAYSSEMAKKKEAKNGMPRSSYELFGLIGFIVWEIEKVHKSDRQINKNDKITI